MAVSILVEISPGELIDKLTIFEIKREQVGEPAKLANVEFEYAALRAVFDRQIVPTDDIEALYDTLREVNRRLWSIEDAIRDSGGARTLGPPSSRWRDRSTRRTIAARKSSARSTHGLTRC